MKKLILSLLLSGALPFTLMAQDDDLYFVPTKENVAKATADYGLPAKTYYSGSSRSVDDYNRRTWSSVAPIDSAGNDIIDFSAVRGVYPDSSYVEPEGNDFQYTRELTRFDDYAPSQAYWDGYRDGRWSSPWYHAGYYSWYDPWYWNDPWYYGSYYSWYSPWSYRSWYSPWYYGGYYGWYGPRWYGGGTYYVNRSAPRHQVRSVSGRRFGEAPRSTGYSNGRNAPYGGTRSYTPSNSSSSFGGGSSFGGSRGGSSSGGGRSASGGRSFGGRR